MFHILGIRHHGPGSARSLLKSLEALHPDCLLVEAPSDAQDSIRYIGHEELIPPVATLIYNPKDLTQAIYLPYASFSPEWQAIHYANTHRIPVFLMDLPAGVNFGLERERQSQPRLQLDAGAAMSQQERMIHYDPIGFLGQLAGYSDGERWWEVSIEQGTGYSEIFPLIIELIRPLREAMTSHLPPQEALREAFMRKTMRSVLKQGYQNVAVVCGAWHAPVLQQWQKYKAGADNKLLRGLKKVKTSYSWIPWSFSQLSKNSGYGAGVGAPMWYKLLFENRKDVVMHWMTRVARLLRKEGYDASSAHAIESVRLANTLAAMRERSIPGIEEVRESAVCVFCEGDVQRIELIEDQLIVGDVMGRVPKEIPVVPLQNDLESCIRSARLTKERNSTEEKRKKLDLRVPSNLAASQLLHRLPILDIPWGKNQEVSKSKTGSFTEEWLLKWRPEFAIRIIEAGHWGNTVYDAATAKMIHKTGNIENLEQLTLLIDAALKADLTKVIDPLTRKLQYLSALTKDIVALMQTLSPLVSAVRYGSTRQLDVDALTQVMDQIIPRICIGLPAAAKKKNEEATRQMFQLMLSTNHAISILNQSKYNRAWNNALQKILTTAQINSLLIGACVRLLFEKNVINTVLTTTHMRYALSRGHEPLHSAYWLEGFLFGSGLLLIHNKQLWNILDEWVDEMPMETLQELLPLLRRTFSEFPPAERQKMMDLAKRKDLQTGQIDITAEQLDQHRAEEVNETIRLLLGWPSQT